MLKLPEKINQSFQQLLINKGLSDKDKSFYRTRDKKSVLYFNKEFLS